MSKNIELLEQIDNTIKDKYKNDTRQLNGIMCLFKTNIDNIEHISKIKDFDIKFKQAIGYEQELLDIINELKKLI